MRQCTYAQAVAEVSGGEIRGNVWFHQLADSVLVTAQISGLPRDGFFAFHIHDGGDCGGEGFSDTGGHYNPTNAAHPDHAGDLPPLLSFSGRVYLSVMTDRFCVADVLGKTVVIHGGTDDFKTQPAGDPGAKIACGIIRRNW